MKTFFTNITKLFKEEIKTIQPVTAQIRLNEHGVERSSSSISAGAVTRLTSDWLGTTNINAIIRGGLTRMRQRSRQLAQEDPYFKKFLRMLSKNIIGPKGFKFRNKAYDRIDDKIIYKSEINRIIQDYYNDSGKPQHYTILGDMSRREACGLMLKTIAMDGGIFVKKIYGEGKYNFTRQLITVDNCDTNYLDDHNDGTHTIMGVRRNKIGKVLGYWFKKTNQMNELFGDVYSGNRYYISAEKISYLFVKESPTQLHGLPWVVPAAVRMKMLSAYEEAALVAMRVGASQALVLKKTNQNAPAPGIANIAGATKTSEANVVAQPIEPGESYFAPDGYEVTNFNPHYPNDKQSEVVTHYLRGIASALDVSFIELASNYTQTSYSSGRLSKLETNDTWRELFEWFVERYLEPDAYEALEIAATKRVVDIDPIKIETDFKPLFIQRAFPNVDPDKESRANERDLKNGINSYEGVLGERNVDLEEHVEQLAYEKSLFDSKGIPWIVGSGIASASSPEDDPEDPNEDDNTNDNTDDNTDGASNGKAHKIYEYNN